MQMSVERPPRPLLSRSRPMRARAHISCRHKRRRLRQGSEVRRREEQTESCMRLRQAEVWRLLCGKVSSRRARNGDY